MINLIPKEEKKKMVRNFYYKLVILFLLTLGASFLILFMAILPSYFLSSVKDNIVNEKLQIQKSESIPLPDQQTLAMIKDLNNKLDLIENVKNDPLQGKKISIQGTAPSREILLLFRQALEDGTTFKQVDLPISNFVKGSNIQFSLSLLPS